MSRFVLFLVFVVHRQRLLFACMVWFTFMYFFWKLGDPFPILSPKHGNYAPIFSLLVPELFRIPQFNKIEDLV